MFIEEFERTMDAISKLYPVLRFQGVEADDIAAYLVSEVPKYFAIDSIWLISSDRDWDLLVSPTVSRFSYVTRKEVTYDNWGEHYDCTPEEYISIKCLTGDTGDNISGITGIGPKRAAELVREYGTALDLYACLPIPSKYKYLQNLNVEAERIPLNYQLMDLVTYSVDAVGTKNIAVINAAVLKYMESIKL